MGLIALGDNAVSLDTGSVIASVTSIAWTGVTRDVVEVTNLGSANAWKEFVKGFKDPGEVAIEGNFISDNPTQDFDAGFLEDFENDITNATSTLTVPNGSGGSDTATLQLALTSFDMNAPVGEALTFSATFKVMGEPTFFGE